jgi:hypothetical protein
MVIFSIRLGAFRLKFSLVNIKGKNPFLQQQQLDNGVYGKIYSFTFMGSQVAVKVIPYSK